MSSDPKNGSQEPVTASTPSPASEQETAHESTQDIGKQDPVRRWTRIILAVCVFLFVWYVLADRYAPWTDQARVQGSVIPMAPKVSGRVAAVNVVQNKIAKEGDLLLQIDPRDFELAVHKAEAALERAGQDVGAGTDAIAVAQAVPEFYFFLTLMLLTASLFGSGIFLDTPTQSNSRRPPLRWSS